MVRVEGRRLHNNFKLDNGIYFARHMQEGHIFNKLSELFYDQ